MYIVNGVPGSGKTYFCVSHLLTTRYKWDDRFLEFHPVNPAQKIFTNISGINLIGIKDIVTEIRAKGGIENFFACNKDGVLLNNDLKNAVIMIDEAQSERWFPKSFKNEKVLFWFQYHRHFGCEVYLMTQSVSSLHPDLRLLPEYYLDATPESLQLGFFRYKKMYGKDNAGKISLRKDQKVFNQYKSLEDGTVRVKSKNMIVHYAFIFSLLLLFIIGGAYAWKMTFIDNHGISSGVGVQKKVKNDLSGKMASPNVFNLNKSTDLIPVYGLKVMPSVDTVEASVNEGDVVNRSTKRFIGSVKFLDKDNNILGENIIYDRD